MHRKIIGILFIMLLLNTVNITVFGKKESSVNYIESSDSLISLINMVPNWYHFRSVKVGDIETSATFTVNSIGNSDVHDVSVTVIDPNGVFILHGETYKSVMPPGRSINFWVDFSPIARQLYSAEVRVTTSNANKDNALITGRGISGKSIDGRAINTPFLNFLQNHPNLFPIFRLLTRVTIRLLSVINRNANLKYFNTIYNLE